MDDLHLEGWLVFIRVHWGLESVYAPSEVWTALYERGWLKEDPEGLRLTPEGLARSDLVGPEWGVETLQGV